MKISTSITGIEYQHLVDHLKTLEAAGFSSVSTQENRLNPFLPLSIAAAGSQVLELKTSVAIAFARSPMVTAQIAWELARASEGRFVLGLGSQVKSHIERRFSQPWSAPASRMREVIQAIRAIWHSWNTGDRLDFSSEHFSFNLMTPNFTPPQLQGNPPPIHIAAVGPAMLRLAARECDGVMLHSFCSRHYLTETILPLIEETLQEAGKHRSDFEISGGGFVVTGSDEEEISKQFEWVRSRIAFYGSTPAYWPVLEASGQTGLGQELLALSKTQSWDEMTRLIDDDLVNEFAAVGNHNSIAEAVADYFGGLTDSIAIDPNTSVDALSAIRHIPTGADQ